MLWARFSMGKGGRFGKYGETKRIARLRGARAGGGYSGRKGINLSGQPGRYKKRTLYRDQITLRQAGETGADYIRGLSRKVFSIYGPYDELLPLWFESGITVTTLALAGKRPVGFAMLGRPSKEWDFSLVGELLAIGVEPLRQKSGIGSLLMQEVLRKAGKLGIEMLVLHTAPENLPAKGLFQKHGFVPVETKENFYPKGQNALMMSRDIF